MRAELLRSPLFQRMGQSVDEDEHSIEMHLPYLAQVRRQAHVIPDDADMTLCLVSDTILNLTPHTSQVVKGREGVTVVPIMVGAIDAEQEAEYGQALAPYLQDPANFFVIRSASQSASLLFPSTTMNDSRAAMHA